MQENMAHVTLHKHFTALFSTINILFFLIKMERKVNDCIHHTYLMLFYVNFYLELDRTYHIKLQELFEIHLQ